MADSDNDPEWTEHVEDINDSFVQAVQQNVDAQTEFVKTWFDAIEESWDTTPDAVEDDMEGYARAYKTWMAAAEEQLDRTQDLLDGEAVSPDEFRDLWLKTANEAFKEVMGTSAFAAATADAVGDVVELQQQVDEAAEETLHTLGFATSGDIEEVGERLVELERRQHDIEQKLDEILDAVSQD